MTTNKFTYRVEFNQSDWDKLTHIQQAIWVEQVANSIARAEGIVTEVVGG